MSPNNIILTIWITTELILGQSILSQLQSFFIAVIPQSEDHNVIIDRIVDQIGWSMGLLIIALPVTSYTVDKITKIVYERGNGMTKERRSSETKLVKELSITSGSENSQDLPFIKQTSTKIEKFPLSKAKTLSSILLMIAVTSSSLLSHLLLSQIQIDDYTNDLKFKYLPYVIMTIYVFLSGHVWAARNLYVFAANEQENQSKILMVCNSFQLLAAPIVCAMTENMTKSEEFPYGDWRRFYLRICGGLMVNLCLPFCLLYWHFYRSETERDEVETKVAAAEKSTLRDQNQA